jgi:hypothetical protein
VKTIILGIQMGLHSTDFNNLRKNGGVAEDELINIIKRHEGNELFLYFRKEFIEIINLANQTS